jgi:hypothetical protein
MVGLLDANNFVRREKLSSELFCRGRPVTKPAMPLAVRYEDVRAGNCRY